LGNNAADHPESIEFITIAHGLQIEPFAFSGTVYYSHRQSNSTPISSFTDIKSTHIEFARGRARSAERDRHWSE
jgi:hypothetical protein